MTSEYHLMTRRRALGASAGLIVAGGILRPPFDGDDYVAQAATCATLTAEQEEGPFYVDLNKVRENIIEGQAGLPLLLHITIINTRTCKPLKHAAVDIWHCNASGIYSDISQENSLGQTYLRGIQVTGKHGTATFKTVFPGHYQGRTTHIHLKVHTGGHVAHTGQLFPTEAVYQEVYKLSPYSAETVAVTSHSQDAVWTGQHGAEAVMKIHQAGHRLKKGLIGHVTLGVDLKATPALIGAHS